MAIYTILIHCSLLFIWVAKYCSGQTTDSSDDISRCATYPVCITDNTCVNKGKCGRPCENGGTCCNTACRCPDGYSGTYCEYENFGTQPSRTIHLATANETSDISIPYFNKNIDTKTSLYFKVESGCECNITLFQEGDHRTIKIIMEDKAIGDRIIRNDTIIHASCHLFRKFNISIRREPDGFTLGTVQIVNKTFLRQTITRYTEGKITNQAIFSSARKTEWTFYEADTVSSMVTNIFKNAAVLCPILPQYKELPLNVNFLNKSLQCSGKIGIETECNTQGIIIEYKCSAEREKCTDLNDTLWIAACHATTDRDCKSCKIRNYKRYIPKICQNDITIVTDDSLLAADNCFEASKYLILWHEIKDGIPPDQYSSQRPPLTAGVFTTLSDSASYTTVKEQSSSTRLLQTTRSLTPIHSDSSTADSMLIDDKKPDQISDNQKVIGLTVGASISAAIIVILLICLFVVLRRRSIQRKSAKKNQTIHNSKDGNDYTGRQNIAISMQEDLTEYNDLVMRRDSHQYGDLKSAGTKPQETSYDYIDPHIHKQETDICKTDKINSTKNACAELTHDYLVLDQNSHNQ